MSLVAMDVNVKRMRELSDEVTRLKSQGRWTLDEYLRINTEALEAGGNLPGMRDWLLHEMRPQWRKGRIRESLG